MQAKRDECIKRFGCPAVRFYEDEIRRLDEDDERRDDPYTWIFRTAAEDRKNYEGFYKNAVRRVGRAKRGR